MVKYSQIAEFTGASNTNYMKSKVIKLSRMGDNSNKENLVLRKGLISTLNIHPYNPWSSEYFIP